MRAWPAIVALACAFASLPAFGQAPPGSSRSIASVNVVVEMSDGSAVLDLLQEDFEVSIDGKVQRIETFSTDDSPVTLLLLVDLTRSVSTALKPDVLLAAIGSDVVRNLRAGDRVSIGRVETDPRSWSGFLSDPAAILKAARTALEIDDERSVGSSPLWDATMGALSVLAPELGRRAVVLVSDGQATGNRHGATDVVSQALTSGVTVHAIAQGTDLILFQSPTVAARVRPSAAMQYLADLTGGIFARDQSVPRRPGLHLGRVVRNIHRSYTIGFEADVVPGALRVMRVVVRRAGVTVRAPLRYMGP